MPYVTISEEQDEKLKAILPPEVDAPRLGSVRTEMGLNLLFELHAKFVAGKELAEPAATGSGK